MDARLQNGARKAYGRLLSQVQHAVETSKADGLRAEVISYMTDNYNDYKDLDLAVINSNMPVQFVSVDERIIEMTDPKSLPGELEKVARSRVMKKKKCVLGVNNNEITSYGDDSFPKLCVRFRNIGQDVGHYDCVVMKSRIEATCDLPHSQNQTRNHPPTPPRRRVNDLLQEPHVPKRQRINR